MKTISVGEDVDAVASSDLRLIKELSFVNFLSLPDGE
jgi:hypothetical protein